jgi:hypothetical protein
MVHKIVLELDAETLARYKALAELDGEDSVEEYMQDVLKDEVIEFLKNADLLGEQEGGLIDTLVAKHLAALGGW